MICTFGLIPCYIFLQRYGGKLRKARPMYAKHIDGVGIVRDIGANEGGIIGADVEKDRS